MRLVGPVTYGNTMTNQLERPRQKPANPARLNVRGAITSVLSLRHDQSWTVDMLRNYLRDQHHVDSPSPYAVNSALRLMRAAGQAHKTALGHRWGPKPQT